MVNQPPFGTPLNKSHPLTMGLNVSFLCNEGGGQTVMNSANSRFNGTLTSSTFTKSQKGSSVEFNSATASEISVLSNVLTLNQGSISMWIKPSFNATDGTFNYFFDSDGARHAFFHSSVSGLVQMYNDARTTNFTGNTFVSGTWYHFVFVYNKTGNVQKMYINGVERSPGAQAGTWGSTALGTNIHIGRRISTSDGSTSQFQNILIYNRNLSSSEIRQLYVEPYCIFKSNVYNRFNKIISTLKNKFWFFFD